MTKQHRYQVSVTWTGNTGDGTVNYRGYRRDHRIAVPKKVEIPGSADPAFRGDPGRYNPEELLVASLSSCHMLWYLHLCAEDGIIVTAYEDKASGMMEEGADGGGCFREVVLQPRVTVRSGNDLERAQELHERAHELCFIANSVNFAVACRPQIQEEGKQ